MLNDLNMSDAYALADVDSQNADLSDFCNVMYFYIPSYCIVLKRRDTQRFVHSHQLGYCVIVKGK